MTQLNFCYTLNPNFKEAIADFTYRDFVSLSGYYFEDSTISTQVSGSNGFVSRDFSRKYDVEKGEIVMSYGYYNSLFDADYTNKNYQTFTPRKVNLKLYDGNNTSNTVVYEKEITIKALHNTSSAYMAMHDDDIKEFIKMNVYKDYLFVAKGENRADLLKAFEDGVYSIAITSFSTIISLHSFVSKFGPFFWMLVILFIVLILFYLITFSIKGIMRYKYQIGILKALGADSITLSNIFVTKMGIIASVIAGASISGIILFTNKIDQILVQAVHDVLRRTFNGLSIVTLKPEVLLFDILFILVIIIVSALLPIFIMRSIKPVDILRERE
jgi:ABC-type antimicrobial peptide transport system permease subunit